jgi:DNA-binding NarL/FixJ family response regulator
MALGDHAAAVDAYHAAKAHLGEDERPVQLGMVRLELAEVLVAAGDSPGAIVEARAALATFERLGAVTARDRSAALLRSLGDTGRSRPQEPGDLAAALTRREREVLDLVRDGLTNAEIAERLYISPKTAEHHVGRILTKLGVRSRAEAAALAVRLAASNPA